MSSQRDFVDNLIKSLKTNKITYKHLFSEFALYYNGIFSAMVCDNRLFVKPTKAGEKYIGETNNVSPYPGAKKYFLIEDKMVDSKWLLILLKKTGKELKKKRETVKKG